MSHLPTPDPIHRYAGDEIEIRVTVEDLTEAQVDEAEFHVGSVSKTLGDGISTDDDDGDAVLVVDLSSDDTDELGAGVHAWQASAGSDPPPVVAAGTLHLSRRLG